MCWLDRIDTPVNSIRSPDTLKGIFVKASLLRRIRDVFWRVRDLLRSCASYFRSLKDTGDSPETHRIKQLRTLSNMNVCAYLNTVKGMTFNYEYLSGMPSEIETNANLIGIPVILKGTFRHHIVGIVIDKTNNTLEFYDPKGLTIMDRKNDTLLNDKRTLFELVRALSERYSVVQAVENTSKHQKDCHNCGVYVSHFFKQRAAGKQEVLSYEQANGDFRREMISSILAPQE